ncbi:MAG TPA: hypothetical protein VFM93_08765 [Candidatus Limnocylindria bacterium]|nr:hypothetical protein [Candidatus Limnocylindria bacterium]
MTSRVDARARDRSRRLSLRASLIWWAALTAIVVGGAVLLSLTLDPRTKEWWTVRWNELAAFVRALIGR